MNKPPVNGEVLDANLIERERLERANALLIAIVDSSDDAIISKNLDGIITSWNKSAERLFGYTAAEAIGCSITMLIPSDRLDEEPKILEQLRRGERVKHFENNKEAKRRFPARDFTHHLAGKRLPLVELLVHQRSRATSPSANVRRRCCAKTNRSSRIRRKSLEQQLIASGRTGFTRRGRPPHGP